MHAFRLPLFLALAAALVAAVGPAATHGSTTPRADSAQGGAEITVPDRCFRERTKIPVTGRGFTPGGPVEVGFASRTPVEVTADDSGGFNARVPVPDLGDSPKPGRVTLFAFDGVTGDQASKAVQLTAVGVAVSDASLQRRGEKIWFRFSGFPNGRKIWGHYLFGGKQQGKVGYGKAKGPCGTLRARAALIPSFVRRSGTWTIQFDAKKKYSRKTKPSLRKKISVFRVPG